MAIFMTGSGSHAPTHYLFVDGGYLRGVLERKAKTYFGNESIELNYQSFFSGIGYNKMFYYDCLPPKKTDETKQDYESRIEPIINHYNALRGLDSFHVFLGTMASEGTKARQKGVDIMISVHMLTHSFRGNMGKATLLTGDLDFKPLIEALVQDGTDITLWYEPASANRELIYAADSQRELSIEHILDHTSTVFRQQYPPPQMWSSPHQKDLNNPPIRLGRTSEGLDVALYQTSGGPFLLVVPDKYNLSLGYSVHIQHKDAGFIEKMMEEKQTPITWDSSI